MITKNQIRFVKSLQQKKYRNENGLFVVEGRKTVGEALKSNWDIQKVYVSKQTEIPNNLVDYVAISSSEMNRISGLKTPPGVLAVVKIPALDEDISTHGITVILDDIRDPGNLGTIIRTCDWFGVKRVICSPSTVELWNPKVVQASMGSIFHLPIFYRNLEETLSLFEEKKVNTYAAILDGEPLDKIQFSSDVALIIGSESHGINARVIQQAGNSVTIPSFGKAESLNASIACAVLLGRLKFG